MIEFLYIVDDEFLTPANVYVARIQVVSWTAKRLRVKRCSATSFRECFSSDSHPFSKTPAEAVATWRRDLNASIVEHVAEVEKARALLDGPEPKERP